MKPTLIFCLSIFSLFSLAMANELPNAIHCTSKAKSSAAREFSISQLNDEIPDSSISDASPYPIEKFGNRLLVIGFSNECDNSYSMTFYSYDLELLKKGKVKEVKGLMTYFDAYLMDEESEMSEGETLEINCILK